MTNYVNVADIEIPKHDLEVFLYNAEKIPINVGGIYSIYDKDKNLLYVGRTKNLKRRVREHLRGKTNTKQFISEVHSIKCIYTDSFVDQDVLETIMINKLLPKYNVSKTQDIKVSKVSARVSSKIVLDIAKILSAKTSKEMKPTYLQRDLRLRGHNDVDLGSPDIIRDLEAVGIGITRNLIFIYNSDKVNQFITLGTLGNNVTDIIKVLAEA